ncbi:uncharacterized protein LOC110481942 [Lonchura striata]
MFNPFSPSFHDHFSPIFSPFFIVFSSFFHRFSSFFHRFSPFFRRFSPFNRFLCFSPIPEPPEDAVSRSRSRLRRRALASLALRELRDELGEGPRQEGEGPGHAPPAQIHRRRFEESMLRRLSAPWRPPKGAGPGLDDVTNLGAFPALLGAANQDSSEPPQKKRKKQKSGKKKGRKGFRRRRR